MAILIPSKNIYNANNPKIIDNVINQVTVEQTIVAPNNEYEVAVLNYSNNEINKTEDATLSADHDFKYYKKGTDIGGNSLYDFVYAVARIIPQYCIADLKFPVLQKNSYIDKVFTGEDKEGNPLIKTILYGSKTTETITASYDTINKIIFDVNVTSTKKEEGSITIPNFVEAVKKKSYGVGYIEANIKIELSEEKQSNIKDKNLFKVENDSYIGTLNNILVGATTYSLSAEYDNDPPSPIQVNGTREIYNATKIEITVYGNTVGISLTDNSVTYGDGNIPYSLNGNELLQNSATVDGVPLTKHLADNILREYKNGKETATILCDISDYYEYAPTAQNLKGNKVISIGNLSSSESFPMTFKIQDQVVPMTFGVDGKDRPMSTKKDGTPKTFVVVGVEMIYDGAVWQKLSLQEV